MAKYYFAVLVSIPEGFNNHSHRWYLWNYFVYRSTPPELNDSKYFSWKSIPCSIHQSINSS